MPLGAETMGERVVCRLITKSIRLLTNHSCTTSLCGVPGPRAIGMLHILEFSGRSRSYPRASLMKLFGIPRYPSLSLATATGHYSVLHSYIERPVGQQQPCLWVHWDLFY